VTEVILMMKCHTRPAVGIHLGQVVLPWVNVFAVMGPIVIPSMTSHREELLMTSCEPLVGIGPEGKK
jgi:hypothetical protein